MRRLLTIFIFILIASAGFSSTFRDDTLRTFIVFLPDKPPIMSVSDFVTGAPVKDKITYTWAKIYGRAMSQLSDNIFIYRGDTAKIHLDSDLTFCDGYKEYSVEIPSGFEFRGHGSSRTAVVIGVRNISMINKIGNKARYIPESLVSPEALEKDMKSCLDVITNAMNPANSDNYDPKQLEKIVIKNFSPFCYGNAARSGPNNYIDPTSSVIWLINYNFKRLISKLPPLELKIKVRLEPCKTNIISSDEIETTLYAECNEITEDSEISKQVKEAIYCTEKDPRKIKLLCSKSGLLYLLYYSNRPGEYNLYIEDIFVKNSSFVYDKQFKQSIKISYGQGPGIAISQPLIRLSLVKDRNIISDDSFSTEAKLVHSDETIQVSIPPSPYMTGANKKYDDFDDYIRQESMFKILIESEDKKHQITINDETLNREPAVYSSNTFTVYASSDKIEPKLRIRMADAPDGIYNVTLQAWTVGQKRLYFLKEPVSFKINYVKRK